MGIQVETKKNQMFLCFSVEQISYLYYAAQSCITDYLSDRRVTLEMRAFMKPAYFCVLFSQTPR